MGSRVAIVGLLTLARFPYFATFASGAVGVGMTPGISKPSVVALRNKDQSVDLD